jgi:hypothetical protein
MHSTPCHCCRNVPLQQQLPPPTAPAGPHLEPHHITSWVMVVISVGVCIWMAGKRASQLLEPHTRGVPPLEGEGQTLSSCFGACLLLLYSRCGVVGTPHGARMYRACCLLLPEVVAAPHTRLKPRNTLN